MITDLGYSRTRKLYKLTKIYYQKSDIIFVFDITVVESFDNLKTIYNEVKQTANINKVLIFIVGNKNDLYEQEQVKKEEAEKYAKSINGIYRCVSALNSKGNKWTISLCW